MRRAALIALAAACAPDVPAEPTWTEDVMPILRANCTRCHGDPTRGGAPPTFRLDRYHGEIDAWGNAIPGAYLMRRAMANRLPDEGDSLAHMPPNGPPLSERQKEILLKWYEAGGPLGPANLPPRVELAEPLPQNADQELTIRLFIEDHDGDAVSGELSYGTGATDDDRRIARVHGGLGSYRWDTSTVAPGTYEVAAVLMDDSRTEIDEGVRFPVAVRKSIGTVTVSHSSGNTAPEISFDGVGFGQVPGCPAVQGAPQRDQLLHSARLGEAEIKAFVFDADGDPLTVTFTAIRGIVEMNLTEPIAIVNCTASLLPTLVNLPDATNWRIKATVTDGTDTRSAVSAAFIVSHATTSLTATDVSPLFWESGRPCELLCSSCHHAPEENCTTSEYTSLDIPSDPESDLMDPWLGKIYRQVVEREEMPPESGRAAYNVNFTDAERALIGEWILGGAP